MENAFNLDEFIGRVQERMAAMNLKASHLARETGVSSSSLSLIFRKERTPSTGILIKLADALGVSIDYLVGKSIDSKLEDVIRQEKIQTFVHDFLSLSSKDRKRILDMIALIKSSGA